MESQKKTPSELITGFREITSWKRIVGFDSETFKITNNVAPQAVCLSFFELGGRGGYLLDDKAGFAHLKELLLDDDVLLIAQNASFDCVVAAVHSPVLNALISRAYKRGRLHCTKIRQQMLTVSDTWNDGELHKFVSSSNGSQSLHSLAGMVQFYFDIDISASKKQDAWRLRYGELYGIPISQWDSAAVDYAINDAYYAVLAWLAQEQEAQRLNTWIRAATGNQKVDVLQDAPRQAYCDFILGFVGGVRGVRINPDRIEAAAQDLTKKHHKGMPDLLDFGLYVEAPRVARGFKIQKGRLQHLFHRALTIMGLADNPEFYNVKKGVAPSVNTISTAASKRAELISCVYKTLASRRTFDTRQRIDQQDLDDLDMIVKLIKRVVESEKQWKEIATFLNSLSRAKLNPDNRLRFQFSAFVATGRTSSAKPNLQQIPRGGAARSCFEPEAGHVYMIADYSAAEFRTLGQINEDEAGAGSSEIARRYRENRSFDPHLFAASRMWELERHEPMPFEQALVIYNDSADPRRADLKKYRQTAKALNFGLAGGLSAQGFIGYARVSGLEFTLPEAEKLVAMWREVWVEMDGYFKRRERIYNSGVDIDDDPRKIYVFNRDGRARYCSKMTTSCNTPFQGLAAAGMKQALIMIWEECMFSRNSPLHGACPVLMVHDELVLEIPHDGSEESMKKIRAAAARFGELMVRGMEVFTPDVPAEAEAALSTRWTKEAEPLYNLYGDLEIWQPKVEEQAEVEEELADLDELGEVAEDITHDPAYLRLKNSAAGVADSEEEEEEEDL